MANIVRNSSNDAVRVYMRPLGTKRAPLLDDMGVVFMGGASVAACTISDLFLKGTMTLPFATWARKWDRAIACHTESLSRIYF